MERKRESKKTKKNLKMKSSESFQDLWNKYTAIRFNQLEFNCTVCNKTFQSSKNLTIHTRTKHTEYTGITALKTFQIIYYYSIFDVIYHT